MGIASGSIIPKGVCVIENRGDEEVLATEIVKIAKEEEVGGVVFGMPSGFDGGEHAMSGEIRQLAKRVSKIGDLQIFFEAEDLTSVQAEEELKSKGVDFRNNKEEVDLLAAVLILEHFLEENKNK